MKTWWAFFFSMLCVLALANSAMVVSVSKQTLTMFFEVLIPSLFFMMVILKTMEQSGLLGLLGVGLHHITQFALRSKINEMPYVLSGLLLGFAGNAMLVSNAFDETTLSLESAKRILYHIHMPTITFCVVTCGSLLGNVSYGFLLYGVQLLVALIGYRFSQHQANHHDGQRHRHNQIAITASSLPQKNQTILTSLTKSLLFSGLGLFQMAGYILLASVLLAFGLTLLPVALHHPIHSIIEFASGAVTTCQLSIPLLHRLMILSMIFGFGGFCGHLQVYTFLNQLSLPYHSYFAMRVMQAILTTALTGLLGYIWL